MRPTGGNPTGGYHGKRIRSGDEDTYGPRRQQDFRNETPNEDDAPRQESDVDEGEKIRALLDIGAITHEEAQSRLKAIEDAEVAAAIAESSGPTEVTAPQPRASSEHYPPEKPAPGEKFPREEHSHVAALMSEEEQLKLAIQASLGEQPATVPMPRAVEAAPKQPRQNRLPQDDEDDEELQRAIALSLELPRAGEPTGGSAAPLEHVDAARPDDSPDTNDFLFAEEERPRPTVRPSPVGDALLVSGMTASQQKLVSSGLTGEAMQGLVDGTFSHPDYAGADPQLTRVYGATPMFRRAQTGRPIVLEVPPAIESKPGLPTASSSLANIANKLDKAGFDEVADDVVVATLSFLAANQKISMDTRKAIVQELEHLADEIELPDEVAALLTTMEAYETSNSPPTSEDEAMLRDDLLPSIREVIDAALGNEELDDDRRTELEKIKRELG